MALQEVVRDYIFHYHTDYLDHYSERLEEKDTVCRSCGKSFKNVWVFVSMNARNAIKRHLVCAIAHNVITLKEAKVIAEKRDLEIDWPEIQKQVDEYLERRSMHTLAVYSWLMGAIAFMVLVPVVPI